MRPVAQVMGSNPYLTCAGHYIMLHILVTRRIIYYSRRSGVMLPLVWIRNVVTYTHYQNDMYVTLFTEVAVMH